MVAATAGYDIELVPILQTPAFSTRFVQFREKLSVDFERGAVL